ncbi:hypothetical protein R3P38DRAFT_2850813 [Favolaschia claudopus]|uniref:F-box domain-containing protein n=1 Tax=Favolaschia claudopus TaxID=2862362 RepID=A0AAW0DN13_9AGAR
MAFLPQELIDIIIPQVGDIATLKACSLVSPMFRYPSQAILMRSLVLSGWSKPEPSSTSYTENYAAARALLTSSPHLIPFITTVKIRLRAPLVDSEGLQWVLRRLVHLRCCSIDGYRRRVKWGLLPQDLCDFLVDFLVHQRQLEELRVGRILDVPAEILVRSTPSLTAFLISVPWREARDLPEEAAHRIRELVLHPGSNAICTLAVSSAFVNLRKLSFNPGYGRSRIVVDPAAGTLEEIHMLRIIKVYKDNYHLLLDTVSSVLTSNASPVLEEIVLTFPTFQRLPPASESMRALDDALVDAVSFAGGPSIRWRMFFGFEGGRAYLGFFEDLLRLGLPKADALGRVVVEEYRADRTEWQLRRV